MPGYNFNHFTGKKKHGNPRKNRKKKAKVKSIHKNKYSKFSGRRECGIGGDKE